MRLKPQRRHIIWSYLITCDLDGQGIKILRHATGISKLMPPVLDQAGEILGHRVYAKYGHLEVRRALNPGTYWVQFWVEGVQPRRGWAVAIMFANRIQREMPGLFYNLCTSVLEYKQEENGYWYVSKEVPVHPNLSTYEDDDPNTGRMPDSAIKKFL